MLNNVIFAAVNGSDNSFGTGAIIALVSIALVFTILALIIGITYGVSKIIDKVPNTEIGKKSAEVASSSANPLNLEDEDATVAALVASIECRAETKMNVKVISVKEIK